MKEIELLQAEIDTLRQLINATYTEIQYLRFEESLNALLEAYIFSTYKPNTQFHAIMTKNFIDSLTYKAMTPDFRLSFPLINSILEEFNI